MNDFRKQTKRPPAPLMLTGKLPPQAPEVEAAVLGSMINETECIDIVLEIVTDAEHFYIESHRTVYEAIRQLYDRGSPVDELTVKEQIRNMGQLEAIGGAYLVHQLAASVLSTAHVRTHAYILKERYLSRELIKMGGQTVAEGYDRDPFELLEEVDAAMYKLNASMMSKDFVTSNRVAKQVIDAEIELMAADDNMIGIPTGNKELDKITGGYKRGKLIVNAARPGVGKTSEAMNTAYCATVMHNLPGGVFSMEMQNAELFNILTAIDTGINTQKIEDPRQRTKEEEILIQKSRSKLSACKWVFDDTPGLKIMELRAKARRMKKKHDIKYLIIDYLQLMQGDGKEWNRDQEISNITRELKKLAKELQIPIIALCQLNREVEKRPGGKFLLSDLRESGGIEQDADIITFLWRPTEDEIRDTPELRGTGKKIIGKHRGGSLAKIVYSVDLSCQRWRDYEVFKESPVPQEQPINNFAGFQQHNDNIRNINWDDHAPF